MRPPIPYFGGKASVADRIVALLPEHHHYVEPFCGSLSVLLAKQPSAYETVNDLDGDLMTFWRVLRDQHGELARVCKLTPHARAEQAAAYEMPTDLDDVERARRVWVQLTQGRNGTLRETRTGWRQFVASKVGSSMPEYLDRYVSRLPDVAERLHRVTLECLPALDLIEKYGVGEEVLLYVDPPYLGSTRGWGNNYKHEMKDSAEHQALAEALHASRAAVVLSGYASDLYDRELYPHWDRITLAAFTGNGLDGAKDRVEVLWSNRPIGHALTLFDDMGDTDA